MSWNCSFASRANHHGNIATEPLMTSAEAAVVTGIFKNRWRVLMSVDDVIAGVIRAVEVLGVADSTYFFYSSDHGFQLGKSARLDLAVDAFATFRAADSARARVRRVQYSYG